MAGPKAVIIGRVAVKVVPDTSGFPKDVERELKSKNLPEALVDVEPDFTGFFAEAKAEIKKAQKRLPNLKIKADLENTDDLLRSIKTIDDAIESLKKETASIPMDIKSLQEYRDLFDGFLEDSFVNITVDYDDVDSMNKALTEARAKLKTLQDESVEIQVGYDEDSLQEAIDDFERRIKDAAQVEIDAQIEADRASLLALERELRETLDRVPLNPELDGQAKADLENEIRDLLNTKAKLKVRYDEALLDSEKKKLAAALSQTEARISAALNEASLASAEAALDLVARNRTSEITLAVNTRGLGALKALGGGVLDASGIPFLREEFSKFTNVLLNLGSATPQVVKTALALSGLAVAAAAAVTDLFSLSSSLASIAPAALALPGILGGIVTGLAITGVALSDFNNQIPQVGKRLGELKALISDNFFAEFKKPFLDFFNTVFPLFKSEIASTSTVLGNFFGLFATGLKNAFTPGVVEDLFSNLRNSIIIFGRSLDEAANLIANLGTVGAQYLPRLATFVGNLIEQFDAFIQKGIDDGSLFESIDRGIEALKDLGRVAFAAFGILQNLSGAATAAGGATLESLANGLERVKQVTGEARFTEPLIAALKGAQDGLTNFFNTAGPGLKTFFSGLSKVFAQAGPTIGKTIGTIVGALGKGFGSTAFTDGLITFFDRVSNAAKSAAPALENIGNVAGPLVKIFGSVAENLGKLIGFGGQASGGFAPLLGTIDEIVRSFGGFLDKALPIVQPLLSQFSSGLNQVFTAAKPAIAEIQRLALNILPVLVPVAKFIYEVVFSSLAKAVEGVGQAFKGINQVIEGVVVAVLKGDFSGLGDIVKGVFNIIVGVVKAVLYGTVVGVVKGGAIRILSVFKGGLSKLPTVAKSISGLIGKAISALWNLLRSLFAKGGSGLVNLLKGSFTKLIELAKTLLTSQGQIIGKLWSTLKNLFSAGKDKLVSLTQALWNGVKNLFSAGVSKASALITNLVNKGQALFNTLKSKVTSAVSALWNKVKSLFQSGAARVVSIMKSLGGKVFDAVRALKDKVINGAKAAIRAAVSAGGDIVGGIAKGIRNGLGVIGDAVKELFGYAKGKVKEIFGINSPAKTMIPLGSAIPEGMAVGVEKGQKFLDSAMRKVKDKVKDKVEEIVDDVFDIAAALETIAKAADFGGTESFGVVETVRRQISDLLDIVNQGSDFKGLERGFTSAFKALDRAARGSELPDFFERLSGLVDEFRDQLKKTPQGLKALGQLQNTLGILDGLGKQFDRVNEAISEQSSLLEGLIDEARSYATSVKDALKDFGSITKVIPNSFEQIRDGLKASILDIRKFKSVIGDLQSKGLNGDLLKQIIEAGPGDGLTTALAVLEGGQQGVKELNALQEELNSLAISVGDTTASYLYDAQIESARGILDGLINIRESIVETMRSAFQQAISLLQFTLPNTVGGGGSSGGGSAGSGGSTSTGGTPTTPKSNPAVDLINKTLNQLTNAIDDGVKGAKAQELAKVLDQYTTINDDKIAKIIDGTAGAKLLDRANQVFGNIVEAFATPAPTGSTSTQQASRAVSQRTTTTSTATTVNYYAAAGSSISAEDDLFKALGKAGLR